MAVNTHDEVDFEHDLAALIVSQHEQLYNKRELIILHLKRVDIDISWKTLLDSFKMRGIFAEIENHDIRNMIYERYIETLNIERRIIELQGIK